MIMRWAKKASTTTTMMGNAALLKNLLTGVLVYLPGGWVRTISRGILAHSWRHSPIRRRPGDGFSSWARLSATRRASLKSRRRWSDEVVGDARFVERGDVWQAAVPLAEIEPVADREPVRDLEADVAADDVGATPFRLGQQGAHLERRGRA